MNMIRYEVLAKIVEGLVFVTMVDKEVDAKIVEELVFVSMVDEKVHANYVKSANTESKQWTVKLVS